MLPSQSRHFASQPRHRFTESSGTFRYRKLFSFCGSIRRNKL